MPQPCTFREGRTILEAKLTEGLPSLVPQGLLWSKCFRSEHWLSRAPRAVLLARLIFASFSAWVRTSPAHRSAVDGLDLWRMGANVRRTRILRKIDLVPDAGDLSLPPCGEACVLGAPSIVHVNHIILAGPTRQKKRRLDGSTQEATPSCLSRTLSMLLTMPVSAQLFSQPLPLALSILLSRVKVSPRRVGRVSTWSSYLPLAHTCHIQPRQGWLTAKISHRGKESKKKLVRVCNPIPRRSPL